MNGKALILYVSYTGNTEKIASSFEETLISMDWQCTKLKLEADTDLNAAEIYFDEFDLVLLGSPVHSCLPAAEIINKLSLTDSLPPVVYRSFKPGSLHFADTPKISPFGVTFVTYSGMSRGPAETEPALSLMESFLNIHSIEVVGCFACPGKMQDKTAIDILATELNLANEETAALLSRYEQNPDSPIFCEISEDAAALLRQASLDKLGESDNFYEEDTYWHYDSHHRPNDRDCKKAAIFLEEIIEDFFLKDKSSAQIKTANSCIS